MRWGGAHWDVARAIAQSSRTTPQPDYEYEEDFLFVFFLMKLFFLGSSAAECRALIAQHNQVTEGEDVEHREVCEALLNRDSSRFNTALDTLLVVRRDLVEDLIERGTMPEEHWAWLRYFSSEGWALLRLAELRGLSTKVDNLHVPEALRGPSPMPFDQLAWRQPQSPYYRPT